MSGSNAENAAQAHQAEKDDQTTVASHDTNPSNRSYGSRMSRGYPTGGDSSKQQGRRDDDSYYSRDRSRSQSQDLSKRYNNGRKPSRSRDRSNSYSRDFGKGKIRFNNTDRYQGGAQNHDTSRYQRSESDAPSSKRAYTRDSTVPSRDFRRGSSSSITSSRSEPALKTRRRLNSASMPRFGSISQSRSPGRLIRPLPPAEIIEWPPCFDSEGSAFIFHPASGMFYEELSEFFYDPKAKVYYGVKKGAYFRYDDSKDPPFVETQRADPAQGTPIAPVEPPVTLPPINAPGSLIGKHKIAIKLKTKKLKKPKVAINTATSDNFPMPAVPSKSHKEQIANIEKWKEKQTELKAILPVVSSGVSAAVAEAQIKKTAKGEPICVICKRKFPTMEKLRLHEIMSELHKSNLAKAAQQLVGEKRKHEEVRVTKEKQQQQQQYHDRAEKRRHLHGPETATAQRPVFASRGLLGKPDGPEGLGENNIGNKLLQKLGWQSGSSVGRKGDGETSEKSLVEELRKDWDRIEAIADKGAR